jgi:hypothetical protein
MTMKSLALSMQQDNVIIYGRLKKNIIIQRTFYVNTTKYYLLTLNVKDYQNCHLTQMHK